MGTTLTCGVCANAFEIPQTVHGLTVCPRCLSSLVAITGKKATGADTVPLAAEDLAALKTLRATLRKAKETVQ